MSTLSQPVALENTRFESREDPVRLLRRAGAILLCGLPGALTVYLSFNAGGYFAGSQGAVASILAGVVALRMAVVRNPFRGVGRSLALAVAALGVYAGWALLSADWSHSPARALLEFDLANVYLFTLFLFGSAASSHRRVRWTVILTWLSLLFVCLVALATRLRPDVFPIPVNMSPNRLAFPLTYWNALGMFAVVGILLAFHLASSTHEPRALRVLSTAAIPVFAVTILLTYSRAALLIGALGLIAYALLARPRGLLGALLAAAPATAFAVGNADQASLVANAIASPAGVAQGRHLTTLILAACAGAALIRIALLELDDRLADVRLPRRVTRNLRSGLGLLVVVGTGFLFFAFNHQIAHQWANFTKKDSPVGANDIQNRISSYRIGGRLPGWRIALHTFESAQVHGQGAGTFPIAWDRLRPDGGTALEAHSLYLQAMSELGIVGVGAIVLALLVLFVSCFARSRRSSRSMWTALGLLGVLWAVHAGVDWDWEMPALTLPVLALTACALTRRRGGRRLPRAAEVPLRLAVGLAAVAVAVTAGQISVSDHYLDAAVTAFNSGQCPSAVQASYSAISAVSSRPQPYAIVAYCDVHDGDAAGAILEMSRAVAHDPQNWRYRYGLGVARAAAGRDPRPALLAAEALDPREQMIQSAISALAGHRRRRWERVAPRLQMPVSMRE